MLATGLYAKYILVNPFDLELVYVIYYELLLMYYIIHYCMYTLHCIFHVQFQSVATLLE